ncbi:hypothetical protein EBR21_05050 [bacterium]|nr:hypothetical protein [bacterium]
MPKSSSAAPLPQILDEDKEIRNDKKSQQCEAHYTLYKVYNQENVGPIHRGFKNRRAHLRAVPPLAIGTNDKWAIDLITDGRTIIP